ncbi:PRC-barrel domain-containing protein [Mesobacillus foraminis]|uniref:Uncharacterized protein YrrD n=1 Tax=Mesobacillus foraminis TaxID=279826 RepID=A0A4R2BCG5_9BACI|nr:PRC-barrel domain-containing protein [Mesobacillus foraminis]MBT2754623.1 PRC-barrel domain-containing protein [Mesobacillus foraminis]TCN24608.1 uncharacterized protein YrrD [Mesobacillus foraminis]
MRTFSLLKGLPVINLQDGTRLGDICDLSVSGDGRVKALLLKKGTFIKKTFSIKVENVDSFGWDGVMVKDQSVLEALQGPPEFTLEHQGKLSGKMMYSQEGEQLGLFEDVYFQEELGTIVGYELTDGFFSDITTGKRVIKAADPPAIGKDAIIVNVEKS